MWNRHQIERAAKLRNRAQIAVFENDERTAIRATVLALRVERRAGLPLSIQALAYLATTPFPQVQR